MKYFPYLPIDRHALLRSDSVQINESLQSTSSRVLLWYDGKLITPANKSLYFLFADLQGINDLLSEPAFLGRHQHCSYFTCQLIQWHEQFDGLDQITLRRASLLYSDYHLGLLYYSQGLINWHVNHPYCSGCGSSTRLTKSGHERQCNNSDCNRSHYPKIDPAVIFSVINNSEAESKILLARQSSWDENRHSVIAGFVEPGEALEDAVQREAYEETGLQVNNINYAGSQPWPFPGQIMLGFRCETDQWQIELVDHELESANWFSASDIEGKMISGELKMPYLASISWQLINQWFFEQKNYELNRD